MDRTISIDMCMGDDALDRLVDPSFVEEWGRLYASCPWATAFQSFAFVDGWYRLHLPAYEPVIVEGRDGGGRLVGLLTVARQRSGRLLVGAGDFHAEYQTWITEDPASDAFPWKAIGSLQRSFPGGRLRLMYLPSAMPVEWRRGEAVWPKRIRLRPRSGGFIDLADPGRIDASLQKSHNRNRVNALRRSGEVKLESVDTVDGLLREIDEIAVLCDLRQGAVNDSLPFTNNPLKRPLHIEMMKRGLLRVTILRVGSAIASAHLDVKNGDDVLLYLAAHAPRFARHSPGSLHTLLLARQLATEGVRRFDLSPGGGYKDRYADQSETYYTLDARFGFGDRLISDLSGRMEAGATSVLSAAGQTPRSALATLRRVRKRASSPFSRRRGGSARPTESLVFQLPDMPDTVGTEPLALDRLEDLLAYRPDGPNQVSIHAFLRLALHRLEVGHRVLTRRDGSRLVEGWWAARLEVRIETKGKSAGADIASAPAVLLYDPILLPTSSAPASRRGALARIGSTVRAIAPDATAFLAVSIDDQEWVEALVRVGATRVGSVAHPPAPADAAVRDAAILPGHESSAFREDLVRQFANGWPADRPDA